MAPAAGQEEHAPALDLPRPLWDRRDRIALGSILAAYILLIALLPLAHNFAYLDDWTYARGVATLLSGGGLQPSDYAQATLIAQTAWGAGFTALFGYSFTILTLATMVLSAVAALAFYVLLRRLGFSAGLAGLGVACLVLNPYYLLLSYSFMTEFPFLALLLLSCLGYFDGLQTGRLGGLWLGSLFAALAYLIRQFGLVAPLAVLLWLLLARQLTWTRLVAVGLLPALAVVGYLVVSAPFGPTVSGGVGRDEILALLQPFTWVNRASHLVYLAAFLPGLTLPLWGRVRHWRLIGALAVGMAGAVYGLWHVKGALVAAGQSSINDLSYTWLQPPFADPTLIYCLGAALSVWLIGGMVERAWPGLRARRQARRPLAAADFLVLVAAILFLGTYGVSAGFLDRYWVPLLPFLIAGGLGALRGRTWRGLLPTGLALAVLAAYGIVAHLDDYALYTAYWDAGSALVAQGVPLDTIRSYTGWEGYYLGETALDRLGSHDFAHIGRVFPPDQIIDPQYVVSPAVPPGYTVVARYPYLSLRSGGQTETILVSRRQP